LRDELLHSGKELIRTDDELLFLALQHDCRFARSKGRPTLDRIGFFSENNLLSGAKLLKFHMVVLRIYLLHSKFFIPHSQSKRNRIDLDQACVKLTSVTAENTVGHRQGQTCELQ
jgi:hypothetical protein